MPITNSNHVQIQSSPGLFFDLWELGETLPADSYVRSLQEAVFEMLALHVRYLDNNCDSTTCVGGGGLGVVCATPPSVLNTITPRLRGYRGGVIHVGR